MTSGSSTFVHTEVRYANNAVSGINTRTSTSQFTGEDDPNWRKKVRNGIDATNAFSATSSRYTPDPLFSLDGLVHVLDSQGQLINKIESNLNGCWMRLTEPANPQTIDITEANNQALKYFIQRANEVQRSIQGGVFIGELREALSMVRNPAKAFRKKLDDYLVTAKKRAIKASRSIPTDRSKRSKLWVKAGNEPLRTEYNRKKLNNRSLRAKAVRSALADTWLESQFGWMPLLSDVDAGAKALARLNYYEYPPLETVSARGYSGASSDANGSSYSIGCIGFSTRERTLSEATVVIKGGVKTSAPNLRPFAEFGFTPGNFLPTVWELIPWSFVADYFTNVGDIIEAYSFNQSSLTWRSKTIRQVRTKFCVDPRFDGNGLPTDNDVRVILRFRPGNPSWVRKKIVRTRDLGTLVPDFQFEIPGMGLKWINLGALARNTKSISKSLSKL